MFYDFIFISFSSSLVVFNVITRKKSGEQSISTFLAMFFGEKKFCFVEAFFGFFPTPTMSDKNH